MPLSNLNTASNCADNPAPIGSADVGDPAAGSLRPQSRLPLQVAMAIAAIWGAFLVGLAILTANPVTLNREQIAQADYVVTATVTGSAADQMTIDKEWKHGITLQDVQIDEFPTTHLNVPGTYVVPLSRSQSGRVDESTTPRLAVTPTPISGNPALTYPATPEAIRQLEQILLELPSQ